MLTENELVIWRGAMKSASTIDLNDPNSFDKVCRYYETRNKSKVVQ